MIELKWGEVGQRVAFGITPDQFDGIELRSIRRQQIGTHIVAMLGEPTGDGFETMGEMASPS